jgi:hypothetical protein
MVQPKFKICRIARDGALELSPIALSAEAAAQRDPAAFLALYEEVRQVYLRKFSQQVMDLEKRGY